MLSPDNTKIKPKYHVPVEKIQEIVARHLYMRRSGLLLPVVSMPRQIAMYLSYHYSGLSMAKIGRQFSRDYKSVRRAVNIIGSLIITDNQLAKKIELMSMEITEQFELCF